MAYAIGVDVGGTKIAAGLVDGRGRILARARRESPAANSNLIEDTIADLVRELAVGHDVAGVGVGAAGFVDARRSTVLFAPNLAWRNEPLKAELESRLDLPVTVENDANAAAWGEFVFGSGMDFDDMIMVTVGTGVGGGIVNNGHLVRGAAGVAGEIGHLRVVPDGRQCGCGNKGCWEQYASGTALVRDARAAADADPTLAAAVIDLAGGDPDRITGPDITRLAAEGDDFSLARVDELAQWLGQGMATLAAILDPAVVVVGGGVAETGELLLAPVRRYFEAELTGRSHRPEIQIRQAQLGNDAGLIGAADLARRS